MVDMGNDAPAVIDQRLRDPCADALAGTRDDRCAKTCHRYAIASLRLQ
jgi:hypothetical protein